MCNLIYMTTHQNFSGVMHVDIPYKDSYEPVQQDPIPRAHAQKNEFPSLYICSK